MFHWITAIIGVGAIDISVIHIHPCFTGLLLVLELVLLIIVLYIYIHVSLDYCYYWSWCY